MPADLPTASHPGHVCYTRSSWADLWEETPLLRCVNFRDRAAPEHAAATFRYRYGPALLPAIGSRPADATKTAVPKPSLLGKYVKVVHNTDPVTTWYGVLTDVDRDQGGDEDLAARGTESYVAYGLTHLLDVQPITTSWVVDDGVQILVDVVIPFNGGTDGRSGGSHRVFAINGDGRRYAFYLFHPGSVHAVHELAGIGRKGFHVAALALRIQGVQGQGRFAGTAHAGHHGEALQGDVQIDIFQIVLAGAFDLDYRIVHLYL